MDIVPGAAGARVRPRFVTSAPTVIYEVLLTGRIGRNVDNPSKLPPQIGRGASRTIITANSWCPGSRGGCWPCAARKRGVQKKMLFLGSQVSLQYELASGRSGARFL